MSAFSCHCFFLSTHGYHISFFLSPLLLSFAYKHAPADVVTAACQTRVRKTRQGGRWLWCVCDGGRGEGRYTTRGRGVRACCRAPFAFQWQQYLLEDRVHTSLSYYWNVYDTHTRPPLSLINICRLCMKRCLWLHHLASDRLVEQQTGAWHV